MIKPITPAQRRELLELAKRATPRPWRPVGGGGAIVTGVHGSDCKIYHVAEDRTLLPETWERQQADAAFIAAAANAIEGYEAALEQYENDAAVAAGECLVEIPPPGTDAARLLVANRLLIATAEQLRDRLELAERALESAAAEVEAADVSDPVSVQTRLVGARIVLRAALAQLRGEEAAGD